MGAYHNALRDEGSRGELLEALEKAWNEIESLKNRLPLVARMHGDVERFNVEVIGLAPPEEPTMLAGDRRSYAMRHLDEEMHEFICAKTLQDQADALVDLVYVALGRLVEMGVAPGPAFELVHEANMRKRRGTVDKRPDSGGLDAVKPDGWTPPDLSPVLGVALWELEMLDEMRELADEYAGEECDCGVEHVSPEPDLPKLLVIGHARHGKDTLCEMLRDTYGFRFTSSSLFCAERVVFPALRDKYNYEAPEFCFEDRGNRRAEWFRLISEFNTPDPTTLGRAIFEENDVYCGLRSSREMHALRNVGAFDFCIWVDASQRVEPESRSSCTVEPWMADFVIDCNGSIEEARFNLSQLMDRLLKDWRLTNV